MGFIEVAQNQREFFCTFMEKNIVDRFTKLSKIGVYLECFTAEFLLFSSTIVEIWLLSGRLGTCHQFQAFQRFF